MKTRQNWFGPAKEPSALPNAHAHNDYVHTRPLFDALAQGFCSVEADIHLVEGKLLVAHDRNQVSPEKTLEALYLEPLHARAKTHGGQIYKDSPIFYLLIDVKSDAAPTYAALRAVLARYADILTEFNGPKLTRRAVTIVVSGSRDVATMKSEKRRLCGIDGRLTDLTPELSASVFPWISDDWFSTFRWNGTGPFPESARKRLAEIVADAHKHGCLVRFWGAANTEVMWKLQQDAGVDLLNADNLAALRAFLLTKPVIK